MNKKIIFSIVLLPIMVYSCQKCPSNDVLQGTWLELTNAADKSKLIFQGNYLYFFHNNNTSIDTFSYSLDTKHSILDLTSLNKATINLSKGCDIQYHKRKKILNVWGLLPPVSGNQSVNNYKQ
jgi:hypothetical protein